MASERMTVSEAIAYDAGLETGCREAADKIARLSRELEEVREQKRQLREVALDTARRLIP